jgi:hypothetical protein
MKKINLAVRMVCGALFALPVVAQAQTSDGTTTVVAPAVVATPAINAAKFSDLKDAVSGRWFDAATTAIDATNPNKLFIGFNSGTDPKTWKNNAFIASTNAFYYPSVMDTIGFTVTAPTGYYIAKLTYSQRGSGYIARTGKISGGASWIVGTTAASLGMIGTNPTLAGSMGFPNQYPTTLPVSITVGLHTFATPTLGSATVSMTGADVEVELLPLPSATLFGTAQ